MVSGSSYIIKYLSEIKFRKFLTRDSPVECTDGISAVA